jgi:hypothetical protein
VIDSQIAIASILLAQLVIILAAIMNSPFKSNRFPVWQYLNQPLFDPEIEFKLSPSQFWRQYQIQFLDRCWHRVCAQHNHPQP